MKNSKSEDRKDELLKTLNDLLNYIEPINYENFNHVIKAIDTDGLLKLERSKSKVGIKCLGNDTYAVSTLSLIATITDILCNERLAVRLDENNKITGFTWFKAQ